MDRLTPRFFNIDFWPLVAIRRSLTTFLTEHADRLRGCSAVDFGGNYSPYRPLLERAGITLTQADIGDVPAGVLRISDDGRLPLEDQSVDLVLSTQVLEHVPHVDRYLVEARRVLKPGGMLLLSTHGTWHLHRVPTDMRRWTIDGLRFDIEQAGFRVDRVVPYVGRMATCTYQRMVAVSDVLRATRVLSPLRVVTNTLGNLRIWVEEACTTKRGRESLQQVLVASATNPGS